MIANAYCPDNLSLAESKISSDSRRSYDSPDSWYEISSSGTSSEDLLNTTSTVTTLVAPMSRIVNEMSPPFSKHISPKVFPAGSSTLNSPASVVLGGRHYSKFLNSNNNNNNFLVSSKSVLISNSGAVITYNNHSLSNNNNNNNNSSSSNSNIYNANFNSIAAAAPLYEYRRESSVNKSPTSSSSTTDNDRIDTVVGSTVRVVANGGDYGGGCNDNNNNSSVNQDNNNKSDGSDKNSVKFSSSSESLSPKQRIVPPSPAFNRNPSYFNSKCSSPTDDYCSFVNGSPLFSSSPRFSNGSLTGSKFFLDRNGSSSLSSPIGNYDNFSENGSCFRKADSEMKRKQAHQNRILEQERERVERLRLEEVLTACADYEKQAQYDRFNKPQNRIKTNGSLPRDKQGMSPHAKTPDSPKNGSVFNFDKMDGSVTLNSENNLLQNSAISCEKLSYPNSPRTRIKTVASPKVNRKEYPLEILENKLAILNDAEYLIQSPTLRRSNVHFGINTSNAVGSKYAQENTKNSKQPYLNGGINIGTGTGTVRRITTISNGDRTVNNDVSSKNSPKINGFVGTFSKNSHNNSVTRAMDNNNVGSGTMLKKCKFLGVDSSSILNTPGKDLSSADLMSYSYHESLSSSSSSPSSKKMDNVHDSNNKKTSTTTASNNVMSTSLINFTNVSVDDRHNNFSSNDYALSKSQLTLHEDDKKYEEDDGIEKLNGLVLELNEIVKENNERTSAKKNKSDNHTVAVTSAKATMKSKFILPLEEMPRKNSKDSKFILPLEEIDIALRRQRFSLKKCELKKLKSEQSRLMDAINNVKTKLLDIQQQKDEIIRELEMEKALLEGELKSENEKLCIEEELLAKIREKMEQCEKKIQTCATQQKERQEQNKSVIEEQQNILNVLQSNLSCIKNESDKASIIESIGKSREILEEEVKSFEDFEFRLLEEEATLLSKRDELHCNINKANTDAEHTRSKIAGLYSQKEQLLQNASDEIKSLELQVRCHTRTLQQNHSRLKDISLQLKETSKSLNEISEDTTDSCDETVYSYKTQSQEDLDRISRVTSDAPIMESGSSNSLGRRTIASLQLIERNRQLHLAQQGSHVIEEERKRMTALKRRVQDEVKAQWEEERKQRENNCSSITSIGSDNSSVMSCDRVTESPNNESAKLTSENSSQNDQHVTENNVSNVQMSSSKKEDKDDDKKAKLRRPSNSSNTEDHHNSLVKLRMKPNVVNQRPESRFSVYRRQSLDLRQHIESAGHQVDHCPHVFVDKISCRGYLQKMTAKFRTWNKRWFVFDRKKCSFTYYSDKSEKKLKGGAYFQGLLDLCIDNTNSIKSPNPQATFIVKSTERVYYLLAPSIEAMRIWFDVLATEIEPYQDT